MVDNVYRTRSLGVATEGLPDQYADGIAAKVWEVYIGDKKSRTQSYCNFMTGTLAHYGCRHVLDVACGTGVDSVMLLEQGFKVTSVDASDKMLKYALKERWNRRKEEAFDRWVIEEANWLTLPDEIAKPDDVGFDAVMCLGNSFAHLPDFHGDLRDIRLALTNFREMMKPGGILIIDHRNYDYILDTGKTPAKNIYYNSHNVKDIHTSVLYVNGRPNLVTMDYVMDVATSQPPGIRTHDSSSTMTPTDHFRLSYYPHRLAQFTRLVDGVFGENCNHRVYGDFKPVVETEPAAFYIHVLQKPKE